MDWEYGNLDKNIQRSGSHKHHSGTPKVTGRKPITFIITPIIALNERTHIGTYQICEVTEEQLVSICAGAINKRKNIAPQSCLQSINIISTSNQERDM